MAIIPGALNTVAQMPDGFTGNGHMLSFAADANATLLSTNNDYVMWNITTSRTITLPSTDPTTSRTVKAGRIFTFVNRGNFDLVFNASGGLPLTVANSINQDATIRRGRVVLTALQDAPTLPSHWYVLDVEERFDITFNFNQGFSTIPSDVVQFTRTNRLASIYVPQVSATSNSGGNDKFSSTQLVPARLIVSRSPLGYVPVFNNGLYEPNGYVFLNPQGELYWRRPVTPAQVFQAWTASGTAGWDDTYVIYPL